MDESRVFVSLGVSVRDCVEEGCYGGGLFIYLELMYMWVQNKICSGAVITYLGLCHSSELF